MWALTMFYIQNMQLNGRESAMGAKTAIECYIQKSYITEAWSLRTQR